MSLEFVGEGRLITDSVRMEAVQIDRDITVRIWLRRLVDFARVVGDSCLGPHGYSKGGVDLRMDNLLAKGNLAILSVRREGQSSPGRLFTREAVEL